jgi:ABC-type multidrug transport system fused ATPase/permease subunit
MNAVERLLYYAEHIEQEAEDSAYPPPPEWPTRGEIELKEIELSHRPGLPLALKGLSLKIRPGEHIGVVGR